MITPKLKHHLGFSLVALTVLGLPACDGKQQGGPPPSGPAEVSVVTLAPERVPLFTELPGCTAAYRVAEVRPQVSGIVLKRLFEEGSEVKARANLKSIEAKATRYADLVKINAVSRQDYDDVVASLDQAKAEIMVAQAAVDTTRISLNYTKVYAPIDGRIGKSSVTEGALTASTRVRASPNMAMT